MPNTINRKTKSISRHTTVTYYNSKAKKIIPRTAGERENNQHATVKRLKYYQKQPGMRHLIDHIGPKDTRDFLLQTVSNSKFYPQTLLDVRCNKCIWGLGG